MKILIAKWDTGDDSLEYTLHFIEEDLAMEIYFELDRLDDPYKARYKIIEDDYEIQCLSGCNKNNILNKLIKIYDMSESPEMSVEIISTEPK